MTFDTDRWVAAPAQTSGGRGAPGRPDWHALKARLFAGYAARQSCEQLSAARGEAGALGSFDPGSAALVAGFTECLTAVNRDHSEHRKPDAPKDCADADRQATSVEG